MMDESIVLTSTPVVANTRKLKVTWTPSLQQDLMAMHGIDNDYIQHPYGQLVDPNAPPTFEQILAEEITREINNQILEELKQTLIKNYDE